MKLLFLFAFSYLFLNTKIALAQNKKEDFKNKIFLKTNPFSFLELEAGLNLGIDILGKSRLNFSGDVNFIFYNIAIDNDNFLTTAPPLGFRFKPELRYYILENKKDNRRIYIAIEGLLTKINSKFFSTVNVNNNLGNFIYTQRISYNEIKTVVGASAKIGYRLALKRYSEKYFLDFYLGLGARQKFFKQKNIPAGINIDLTNRRGVFNRDDIVLPSLPLGIKFVVAIN